MSQEKSDVLYLGLQAGEQPLGLQISSTNLCRLTSVCRRGPHYPLCGGSLSGKGGPEEGLVCVLAV